MVHCDCGRLCTAATCELGRGGEDADVTADLRARRLDCDATCKSAARARTFALSVGAVGATTTPGYSPFPDSLLGFARENGAWVATVEDGLREFVLANAVAASDGRPLVDYVDLEPMAKPRRAFLHQLAQVYGLTTVSIGVEPKRFLRVVRSGVALSSYDPSHPLVPVPSPVPIGGAVGGAGKWVATPSAAVELGGPGSGFVAIPSLTCAEAARAFAGRAERAALSASGAAVAEVEVHGVPVHSSEPHAAAMDAALVGTALHLYSTQRRGGLREGDVVPVITAGGLGGRWRLVDDQHGIVYADTQGRAGRIIEAVRSAAVRGVLPTVRVRYWGVGVEEHMARAGGGGAGGGGGHHISAAAPAPVPAAAPGAWGKKAAAAAPAGRGAGRGAAPAAAGASRGGSAAAGGRINAFAAAFGDSDEEGGGGGRPAAAAAGRGAGGGGRSGFPDSGDVW
jgi:hypothetical protein